MAGRNPCLLRSGHCEPIWTHKNHRPTMEKLKFRRAESWDEPSGRLCGRKGHAGSYLDADESATTSREGWVLNGVYTDHQ